MKFIDEVKILAIGGAGGNGCMAFRREKYVPRGGPSGGDGGRGGHVILRADRGLTTLLDLKYRPRLVGERGEHGRGSEQYGRGGDDLVARVPVGTIVHDADTGERLADLDHDGAEAVVSRGGRGGLGNIHFKSSTNQAPRHTTPGEPGEERQLRLELRLLADVGVLGFPNAGKSSLIGRLSAARPKIGDYPFTTLVPQLGVVRVDEGSSFVIADVPGLIEGAHQGTGLGTRFLRHLSRTALLLHVLDLSPASGRDPIHDFAVINRELELADPELAAKPQIVAANKLDLAEARERFPEVVAALAARGHAVLGISAATGEGLPELVRAIARALDELRREAAQTACADDRAEDGLRG
ncbi:MAG: GTPase ObgE [Deltaproteobacteria bacterium]|nr:GTPase ObgE [Deltaproteobacteria bacterium]